MGIQGLLPTLKSIITPVHVRQYAGKKAAIDTYSWLHKAAYTCSKELCNGQPTDKFVDYCMHRVNLLRHYGVQPVLIFDGGVLPMKAEEEAKRARSRREYLERAQEHERVGNHSAAFDCYQRAVDITPALAFKLIKVLRQEGVEYIVAPYEADAQMAYLALNDLVDVIITEDSDLIAYGCPRVLFKMNKYGQGDEFQLSDLVRNKDLNFTNFTKQMVLEMCVMTGCDYLPSLPGMGVKKAHGLIRRFKGYQKVIKHLRFSGVLISAQYEELFERALLTFHHQRVFDPVHQEMVHLTEVPNDLLLDLDFVGPDLPDKLVKAIANGEVDPSTRVPFQNALTTVEPALPRFNPKNLTVERSAKKHAELREQKNLLTNYFFSDSEEVKKQFKTPRSAPKTALQTKDRLAQHASGVLVPEREHDLINRFDVYPKAAEVFGTPLPDDDSDSEVPQAVHDNIPGFELQERISARTRVLQDCGESSVSAGVTYLSAATTGRFSSKQRKEKSNTQLKLSGYFSHPRLVHSKSVKPDATEVITRESETDIKDQESCSEGVMKKSKVSPREGIIEKVETECPILQPSTCIHFDSVTGARRKSTELFELQKWNGLSPVGKCSGGNDACEVDKFSSDVSHVDQFSHVAQRSMDKFVETISSFRCSLNGTRASGLRAPMSIIDSKTSTRIAAKGQSTLSQFSSKTSSFKPPRLGLGQPPPRLVTTGAVRSKVQSV